MGTAAHAGEARFLQRPAPPAASTLEARGPVRLVVWRPPRRWTSTLLDAPGGAGRPFLLTATNGLSQAGVGRCGRGWREGVTGRARTTAARSWRRTCAPSRASAGSLGVDLARFLSLCSVPILSGDRLVGIRDVQSDEQGDLAGGAVALLAAMAAHVAGARERGELPGRLEGGLASCPLRGGRRRLSPLAPAGLPERLTGFADPERRDDDLTVPPRAGSERLGRPAALGHGATVLSLELMRARAEAGPSGARAATWRWSSSGRRSPRATPSG